MRQYNILFNVLFQDPQEKVDLVVLLERLVPPDGRVHQVCLVARESVVNLDSLV